MLLLTSRMLLSAFLTSREAPPGYDGPFPGRGGRAAGLAGVLEVEADSSEPTAFGTGAGPRSDRIGFVVTASAVASGAGGAFGPSISDQAGFGIEKPKDNAAKPSIIDTREGYIGFPP
ncbi:MAG: hypothetical protein V2B18_02775 [Pseudomonadota bacterium]